MVVELLLLLLLLVLLLLLALVVLLPFLFRKIFRVRGPRG